MDGEFNGKTIIRENSQEVVHSENQEGKTPIAKKKN